ncbi:MAG TPA: polysaccharide biosynthesis/export family protein [Bryobacteraceae bacterium]|jgi:polysaccharide export outer membrane protein
MRVLLIFCAAFLMNAQEVLPPGINLPARPLMPNDLLSVTVYGAPELTRTVRVSSEGTIRMPMLMLTRTVEVTGLMPSEVETRVAAALTAEEVLVDPAVTVTVAEYYSRPISVAGAVRLPLTFRVYEKTSLLEALTRAQGLGPDAGTEVLVTRPPKQPGDPPLLQRVPVKGLIDGADPDLNLVLEGGEEVRVPAVGRIFVMGNVKKPGAFALENNAGMTVLKALALAEGLAPFPTKQAYIYRHADSAPGDAAKEVPVELQKILARKSPDVALDANDILYVPDNRSARLTAETLEKAIGFGAATASGVLIYGVTR